MAEIRNAYCSWCLDLTVHDRTRQNLVGRDEYRCRSCEEPTNGCRYCDNMARGKSDRLPEAFLEKVKAGWANELCAEHNGTVATFEGAGSRLPDLAEYQSLFERKTMNLKRVSQIAGMTVGGAAVFGPLSLVAAPSIAGALGSAGMLGAAGTGAAINSLSGAALVNASLAALGGSMGMTGGVAFLTAAVQRSERARVLPSATPTSARSRGSRSRSFATGRGRQSSSSMAS